MTVAVLHHDDADGFGAAYACWCGLKGAEIAFIPVQYGQPVPDIPAGTEKVFIVDFSYDRATCVALAERYGADNIAIIDHHKTAEAALAGLPFAEFNGNYSGAVLAWHYFFPLVDVPPVLAYVQDRDLWKWELPNSKEVNAYIATLPKNFEAWGRFDLAAAVGAGAAIIAFQNKQVSGALKDVRFDQINGYMVPVLNCTANISEVGNDICAAYPDYAFSASYCDRADGKRSYSLRSVGDFDVSEVAKRYGGGGHRNAAGFTVKAPEIVL